MQRGLVLWSQAYLSLCGGDSSVTSWVVGVPCAVTVAATGVALFTQVIILVGVATWTIATAISILEHHFTVKLIPVTFAMPPFLQQYDVLA